MSTTNIYSGADSRRYTASPSPDTAAATAQIILSVLAGLCGIYIALDYYGFPVRFWLQVALSMAWGGFVDLVPERLLFALDPSSNPCSVNADADTELKKPANMQAAKSEVLRKAFRLDGLGFFKSAKGDGPLRGISKLMKASPSDAPPGLGNWDNSCYQNSVIQGLAALPSLKAYLTSATSEFPGLSWNTTNGALFDTISRLHDHDNFGQRLWTPGKLKSMSSFQQQDAQEYYSKILDELDKEILKSLKDAGPVTSCGLSDAHDSVDKDQHGSAQAQKEHPQNSTPKTVSSITRYAELQNPLDGLLAQRVGCIRCGYTEGLSMIPFNCITVPLGRDWIYDVRDCLSDYTKLELIEGVDCAKCSLLRTQKTLTSLVETPERKIPKALRKSVQSRLDAVNEALEDDDFADNTLIKKCQVSKKSWVSSTKSRQAVVARPPNALVIHINRSVFDELTGAQMKNYADVRFPKDLDLGPWCLGSRSGSEEEWSEDPTSSMIADLDEDIASSPFQYTLRAVVTHYGRHENGHYICYRKHQPASNNHETQSNSEKDSSYSERESPPSDQAWWRLSDEDVSKVSEEAVLSQGGVFMLFYERCDSNSVPTSPVSLATAGDAPIAATATPLSLGKDAAEHFEKDHVSLRDAAGVPLPDDDDEGHLDLLLQSPVAPVKLDLALSSYPTPPPEDTTFPRITDEDSSATDTGDPSAHMTSDDDIESGADIPPTHTPANQTLTNHSPALMRTAGTSGGRRNVGSRASLPMVAAT